MSERPAATSPASQLVEQTLDEHGGCMKLVVEVENCLDRHPDHAERWVADLEGTLTKLIAAMREHMKGEEAGPIFRTLPESYPRLAGPLARLESEHAELLNDADAVIDRIRALRDPEVFELRELNARTQLFIARFRRHEAAENEIVLEAYWDDIGGGD
ncbi:MAG: hemerythrin domain-containing protein [Planctomycetota bacterium]|nr:hemerythrin domain-containing protein [Planctomycetota bacterium]